LETRDFEFIASVLGGAALQGSALESLLREPDTLDAVLDQPQLFQAIIGLVEPLSISPQLYFYVLVRDNLKNAGIDDIDVADYIAATLANHARGISSGSRAMHPSVADFSYHVDFIGQFDGLSNCDRFFLHVHCGNQFLVLTGLFPSFLRRRSRRRGAPGVRYYEGVACDAFLAAREHPLAEEFAVADVYGQLAGRFRETRRALNKMAEDYLFLEA
jgi:hypothetical protein